ncbi:hypothetical protein PM082_023432 [Marasmius tenuissimus]|nr:hypothetical protein PM082_023432 [Marasmius tenuissimus]
MLRWIDRGWRKRTVPDVEVVCRMFSEYTSQRRVGDPPTWTLVLDSECQEDIVFCNTWNQSVSQGKFTITFEVEGCSNRPFVWTTAEQVGNMLHPRTQRRGLENVETIDVVGEGFQISSFFGYPDSKEPHCVKFPHDKSLVRAFRSGIQESVMAKVREGWGASGAGQVAKNHEYLVVQQILNLCTVMAFEVNRINYDQRIGSQLANEGLVVFVTANGAPWLA